MQVTKMSQLYRDVLTLYNNALLTLSTIIRSIIYGLIQKTDQIVVFGILRNINS